MNWVPPKLFKKRRRKANFHVLIHGVNAGAILTLADDVLQTLRDYADSTKHLDIPYFFAFQVEVLYARTAQMAAQIVLCAAQTAVEHESSPYTIDWYSIERRENFQDVLLTFALRPCDLRELTAE